MSAVMNSILYTLTPDSTSSLNFNDPIVFNYDYYIDSNVYTRNSVNGQITISQPGKYLINWWVTTQSSTSSSAVGFAVRGKSNNASTYDNYQAAVNSLKTGQLAGNTMLVLSQEQVPYTFQLVNITGYSVGNKDIVVLSLYSTAQAGIIISQLPDSSIGITGPTGPMGPTGPEGIQGIMGSTGPQGIPGITGSTGPQGNTGPQGTRGPQGIAGPRGVAGPQGPRGPQGFQGDPGAQGDIGPTGPAGVPNKISSISNSLQSSSIISINYQDPIIFNNSDVDYVLTQSNINNGSSISMNSDGTIDLLEPGLYDFDWYLNIQGMSQVEYIAFDIIPVINGIPDYNTNLIHCSYPLLILGQLSGQGVIPINSPMTVMLINSSPPINIGNSTMTFSENCDIQGTLRIIAFTTN